MNYRWFREKSTGKIVPMAEQSIEAFQASNRVDLWQEVAGMSGAPLERIPHSEHHQMAATEFRSWLASRLHASTRPAVGPGRAVTEIDGVPIVVYVPNEHDLVPWLARYFRYNDCNCKACAQTQFVMHINNSKAVRIVWGIWGKIRWSPLGHKTRRAYQSLTVWWSKGLP